MMASSSTQPATAAKRSILTPVMTSEGHEPVTYILPNGEQYVDFYVSSIAYFPDGKQMISGSADKTNRQWDLRTGKEVKEARDVCEHEVRIVAVSRNGRWVVTAGRGSVLRARDVETGIVKTFEDLRWVNCIDISANSTLLAGGSWNETWIWSLDTGKLVAGPFETVQGMGAVRFSQDSKKLAVMSGMGMCLEVWDVQTQKLDVRVTKRPHGGFPPHVPVFWTTKDKTIVAAFSFKVDFAMEGPKTIYEFDASTLEIVGASFEGHTYTICHLWSSTFI